MNEYDVLDSNKYRKQCVRCINRMIDEFSVCCIVDEDMLEPYPCLSFRRNSVSNFKDV